MVSVKIKKWYISDTVKEYVSHAETVWLYKKKLVTIKELTLNLLSLTHAVLRL